MAPRKSIKSRRIPKREAFLAAYAQLGNITAAAKMAGVDRKSHYDWLADDVYAKAFNAAHEQAADALEAEARRRAVEGHTKPVYQGGKKVGTIREYSDTLLIFLLKGARPEKFRERHDHRHAGHDGGAVKMEISMQEIMDELDRREQDGSK